MSHASIRCSSSAASAATTGRNPGRDVMGCTFADPARVGTRFVGDDGAMTEGTGNGPQRPEGLRIVTLGPDGSATEETGEAGDPTAEETSLADMVEQPAKVMRIGTMIKQLLEEVRAAPLDEASRARLREIHQSSI